MLTVNLSADNQESHTKVRSLIEKTLHLDNCLSCLLLVLYCTVLSQSRPVKQSGYLYPTRSASNSGDPVHPNLCAATSFVAQFTCLTEAATALLLLFGASFALPMQAEPAGLLLSVATLSIQLVSTFVV